MDVLTVYTSTTAIWLSLQSLTLFLFPRLILDLLSTTTTTTRSPPVSINSTETYLAQLLAVALLALTIVALYFTYFPPSDSDSNNSSSITTSSSPSSSAITHILTLFHVLSFIVIYARYLNIVSVIPSAPVVGAAGAAGPDYQANTAGYILGAIGYGVCATLGVWVLVFGSSPSRLSKRTGADKRTAGWPFTNAKAYNKRKDKKLG